MERFEIGVHGEEFAADAAYGFVGLGGAQKFADEIGCQANVGVQREGPVGIGERDGLILAAGETAIVLVIDNAGAVFKGFQNFNGAVGAGVVDDDNGSVGMILRECEFETTANVAAAVEGDDGNGNDAARVASECTN